MLSYEGIFFDEKITKSIQSLELLPLSQKNSQIHCVFKKNPEQREIFNEIVGKQFDIYFIGYGNNGKNSGFQIAFPGILSSFYLDYDEEKQCLQIPQIIVSHAKGNNNNEKQLTFYPIKKPIKITGRFGYWMIDHGKEYVSYEPYISKA